MSESGISKTRNLTNVLRIINGKSSLCVGTIAMSITCVAKMVDGKPTIGTSSSPLCKLIRILVVYGGEGGYFA